MKSRAVAMGCACLFVGLFVGIEVAAAADVFGAIAYSKSTGKWGYSYDYSSREEAESAAVGNCDRNDCVVKSWFKNSCGALAKASNKALGYSWGAPDRERAERIALSKCRERGSRCRIITWACTKR